MLDPYFIGMLVFFLVLGLILVWVGMKAFFSKKIIFYKHIDYIPQSYKKPTQKISGIIFFLFGLYSLLLGFMLIIYS